MVVVGEADLPGAAYSTKDAQWTGLATPAMSKHLGQAGHGNVDQPEASIPTG